MGTLSSGWSAIESNKGMVNDLAKQHLGTSIPGFRRLFELPSGLSELPSKLPSELPSSIKSADFALCQGGCLNKLNFGRLLREMDSTSEPEDISDYLK